MSNKVISIEIGLHTTKICEVDYKKKNPHVYNCITFSTPENTFEDGYIRDKNKFVTVVKAKIKEANMKSKKVVFTVASTKIANREVIIPFVKNNRIQDVINANAAEYFPVDISEYIITYSILQRIITKEEKKYKLLVLAAPDNLIKNYFNVAEMMDYDVVAIDYIGNSTYQLITKQVDKGTNLVIQMNEQTTQINILEDDVLGLQRSLNYGTSAAINTILSNHYLKINDEKEALQLLYEKELINKQFDTFQSDSYQGEAYQNTSYQASSYQASSYQNTSYESEAAASLSIYADASGNQGDNQESRDSDYRNADVTANENMENEIIAREEITDAFRHLINSLTRVLDYYYSKNKDKKINAIYITGQGAKFKGIEDLFNHETGIEVKKIDTLNSVIFKKRINVGSVGQSDYISCIGATMNPVHFIPKEYLLRAKKNTNIHSIKLLFGSSIIVSILLITSSYLSYKAELMENLRLTTEIENLSEVNVVYDAHLLATNENTAIKSLYDLTVNPNEGLNELIAELEEKLPRKAIVETMNVTSADINLSFKTNSKATAAAVLQQLKTISSISEVSTNGITESKDENGIATVRFIVSAKYKVVGNKEESNGNN